MSTQWFVKIDDKVTGPYTSKQLKQLAKNGLTPSADVCKGDNGKPSKQWVSATKVRGLFDSTPSESPSTTKSQKIEDASTSHNEKIWIRTRQNNRGKGNGLSLAKIKCDKCKELLCHRRKDYGVMVNCPRCNHAFTLKKTSMAGELLLILIISPLAGLLAFLLVTFLEWVVMN